MDCDVIHNARFVDAAVVVELESQSRVERIGDICKTKSNTQTSAKALERRIHQWETFYLFTRISRRY